MEIRKIMLFILILGCNSIIIANNSYEGDYQYEPKNSLFGASFTGLHYESFSYGDNNPKTSYNVNIKWPINTSTGLIDKTSIPAGHLNRSVFQITKKNYKKDFEGRFFGYGIQISWDKFNSEPFGFILDELSETITSSHIIEQGIGGEILAEYGWRFSLGNTFTIAPCIGLGYGFSMVKDSRETITLLDLFGTEEVISNPNFDQDPGFGGLNMHIGLGFGLRQKN